jgi:hypothetical protein
MTVLCHHTATNAAIRHSHTEMTTNDGTDYH